MSLRSRTTTTVRRALQLTAAHPAGSRTSSSLEIGRTLASANMSKCLSSSCCGSSKVIFRSGLENFRGKSSCECIKGECILSRKEVPSWPKPKHSSMYYHSSSCSRSIKTVLPNSTRLRYPFPSSLRTDAKYLIESRFFSTLESSRYVSLHTSRQNSTKDDLSGQQSSLFMEEEESTLQENISPLLYKFLSNNPFLSSANVLKDPICHALSQCQDVAGVLSIIDTNRDDIDIERASVAVAKLWSVDTKCERNSFILRFVPLPFQNVLSTHPCSARLLEVIERDFLSLDDDSVVCLLTYLTNIGVPTDTPVMQKLFVHIVNRIDHLELATIARIFVFLRSPNLNHHVKGKFTPRIVHFLEKCSTAEDLHLINICFIQTRKLVQESFCAKHSQKIVDLLDSGVLGGPTHTNILINTLQCATDSYSVCDYEESICKIFKLLARRNSPFEIGELTQLNVMCRVVCLHRSLMFKLQDQAARDLADCQDPVKQMQLFLCLDPRTSRKFSKSLEPVVAQMLNSPDYVTHLPTVYHILRLRVFDNFTLVDEFWDKMMALTETSLLECAKRTDDAFGKEVTLSRIIQRYLAFNSNLGGQYRHREVEGRLMALLFEEITSGATAIVVGRLARMATFVIAYSGPRGIPPSIIGKLEKNADQFDIRDLLNLTTGLQIALSLSKRNCELVQMEQMVTLACLLSSVSRRIAQSSTRLVDLSSLIRASAVYDQVFTRFPGYAISMGVNGTGYSNPFTSTAASSQRPTNNLLFKATSVSPINLPRGGSNLHLPVPLPETYNYLAGNSGPMSGGVSPMSQQGLNFTQRPLVAGGRPHDSGRNSSVLKDEWMDHAGVHRLNQCPSTTSSLKQLAPMLTPYTQQMSIKAVLQLAQTFSKTGFANLQVLDGMMQYLARHSSDVPSRIVAQALFACYTLGHCSNLSQRHITTLAAVITQDASVLHGMQLLQATLSLCLYQALSRALIASVFNVEFLDLLDEELESSYSKPRHPQRVRQLLMEVNRGMCIDYPEARVPWFHDQYCSDAIQTASHLKHGFKSEVQTCLSDLLGGETVFSVNTYSPYYYHLDFTFELDRHGNAVEVEPQSPLQPRTAATSTPLPLGHSRYCVLLLNNTYYSVLQLPPSTGSQQVYQLKGPQQLKRRHLEVLGYRVVSVPRHEWQSMALATPESKRKYLRRMIWPQEART